MQDVSLIFVTMDRPHAAQRLVFSVRKRFPEMRMLVADQTEPTETMRRFYAHQRVDALWMPHDSGVTRCRNALVERAETPYLLLCDDDLIFTRKTDLSVPRTILESDSEVGVVGGRWFDRYDGWPDVVRHWQLFLNLDRKNKILTAVPAYHFLPNVRYAGSHKYYLCDAIHNFSLFRAEVFEDEAVRWDPRFKSNGEHEDFYLNFKEASPYRVAYYPGLVCVHHRPRAPVYERMRERSEGWRWFMEKWGIEQYCELDHGTRTLKEPDKVHKDRSWKRFFSEIDHSSDAEWESSRPISLTEDKRVILARHYDPENADVLRQPRHEGGLVIDEKHRLSVRPEPQPIVPKSEDFAARLESARSVAHDVRVRFQAELEMPACRDVWITALVDHVGEDLLEIGQGSATLGTFCYRWRRGSSYVAVREYATDCFAHVAPGRHEQVVHVETPSVPGFYELDLVLVVGDTFTVDVGSTVGINICSPELLARRRRSPIQVTSQPTQLGNLPSPVQSASHLNWIRESVRVRLLQNSDVAGTAESLVALAVECDEAPGSGSSDVLLTHHWKKSGQYVAWDLCRHRLAGLEPGHQVRTVVVRRPLDPTVDMEVGAVVPSEGYVPMFTGSATDLWLQAH